MPLVLYNDGHSAVMPSKSKIGNEIGRETYRYHPFEALELVAPGLRLSSPWAFNSSILTPRAAHVYLLNYGFPTISAGGRFNLRIMSPVLDAAVGCTRYTATCPSPARRT